LSGQLAGLGAGAGDDDAPAKEGKFLEPVELGPQIDDIADDGQGGRFEAGLLDDVGDGFQGALDGLLAAGGSPADHGHRGVFIHAVGGEGAGDLADAGDAHENDFGAGRFGGLRPIGVPGSILSGSSWPVKTVKLEQ
jgi:hypothetical protein